MVARIALLAVLAAVSACASSGDAELALANSLAEEAYGGESYRCDRVYQTGSHLPQVICMTDAEREKRRRKTQDTMHSLHGSTGPAAAGAD